MFSSRAGEKHGHDGHRGPGGADGVAAPGGPGGAEALQREDEADRGDEVEQRGPGGGEDAHGRSSPAPAGSSRGPSAVRGAVRRVRGGRFPRTEHFQHPVCDHKTSHQVDGREGHRQQGDGQQPGIVGLARHDDGADQDDAVDRVGAGHQRRVEFAGDLGDDLEADKDGEFHHRE